MTMIPRYTQMTPSSLRRLRDAPRSMYVVAYDIADDRRRRRVAKITEGLGHRAQQSVFLTELSVADLESARRRLLDTIDPEFDTLLLARSSNADMISLGRPIPVIAPRLVVA